MSKIKCLVALGLAGAITVVSTPSTALPVLTNTAAVKTAAGDEITPVRWGWGWGAGALIGGIALGAALARPSYAYYGYPGYYGYGYPSYGYYGYPYAYGSYYGGYPYWGVRRAYWGGYGGWGVRRAYWGGVGVRRAYYGGPRGYWRGRR